MKSYLCKYESAMKTPSGTERKLTGKLEVFLEANKTLQPLLEAGYCLTLTDVRDYMSITDDKIIIQNSEIKALLAKKYGDKIRFVSVRSTK